MITTPPTTGIASVIPPVCRLVYFLRCPEIELSLDWGCLVSVPYRMNGLTDYFFAMPSFLSGIGRSLDVGGKFDEYNFAATPEETDAIAIYIGFRAVGKDMMSAYSRFEREFEREPE